jgi:hypothetical protein
MEEMSSELSKIRLEKQKWNTHQEGNQNTNKNRRPYSPHILHRYKMNNDDQKIQTPLQNNCVEESEEVEEVDEYLDIHLFGDELVVSQLTYEDSLNAYAGENPDNMLCNTYQHGYNLRSKQVLAKSTPQKDKSVAPATQTRSKIFERKQVQPDMKITASEAEKFSSPFSLEHEISQKKIPIPLIELVKTNFYRSQILKWLQPSSVIDPVTDVINIQDEKPTIVLGPIIEERDESTPHFYVSLNIHDKNFHNCMLNSGASHNLVPNVFMEELGLEIKKSYHDLFSFDSKKVKCLGGY